MPVEVIMPKVDMDMASGRIAVWHVAEGTKIEKSAPLFDIETDKAAMEVESPASGVLRHVVAPVGADIAIGQPVAWIYAESEEVGPAPAKPGALAPDSAGQPRADPVAAEPSAAGARDSAGKTRATPLARKLARDAGLALSDIVGSGARGRIQRADVERAIGAAGAPSESRSTPLSVLRSGSGKKPPFVLIHGLANDAAGWARLEAELPEGHPIYKIELPGHGRSPRRTVRSFADLVAEALKAFDALDFEAAHVVGHSLGGAVALALADARPRRLASLTLLAPAGLGPEINGAALRGICAATRAESLAPWLKTLTADPDAISWNYVRSAMAQRTDRSLRLAQTELADAVFPDGVQAFDLTPALNRLEAPARIIWGRKDTIIPWRHALRAPGRVSLNLFDETGHLPHFERAEQIGILLRGTM